MGLALGLDCLGFPVNILGLGFVLGAASGAINFGFRFGIGFEVWLCSFAFFFFVFCFFLLRLGWTGFLGCVGSPHPSWAATQI